MLLFKRNGYCAHARIYPGDRVQIFALLLVCAPAHILVHCSPFNYSPTVVIVHILNSKQSGRHEDGMASELLGLTEFQSTS